MVFDIVIIGAGPSGLAFACSLANTDLKIAIIEKSIKSKFSNPLNDGRDIALTHRSIDILKKLGIWKFINSELVSQIKEAKVLDGNSTNYLHFDHSKTVKNSLGCLVPSQVIKKAIYKKIKVCKKIKIFTKKEVKKIISTNAFSKIYTKTGDIFKSKLNIVADGRLSAIRKKIGIYANKTNFKTSMTVFRMKHDLDNFKIASEYFHYDQTLAILPIKKKLSSIVVTLDNDKSKKFLKMENKEINKKIENDLNGKFGKMSLIGKKYTYPMITIYSNEFFRNRSVLIGDSAVGMHPVTAHGFNLNLRGIDILQNEIKMALLKKIDFGSFIVLKKYEKKFKLISLPIYLATNSIVKLYTKNDPITKIARKSFLQVADALKPAKNAIIDNLLINNS